MEFAKSRREVNAQNPNPQAQEELVKRGLELKQKELEIEITKKGADLYKSITNKSIEDVFSALSPDEIQKLTDYLKKLFLKSIDLLDINTDVPLQLYLSRLNNKKGK